MPNFKRRDKSKPTSKYALDGDFLGMPAWPDGTGRNELATQKALHARRPTTEKACRSAAVTGCLEGEGSRHCGPEYPGAPMNFASDNAVGVAPEILAAIAAANVGG